MTYALSLQRRLHFVFARGMLPRVESRSLLLAVIEALRQVSIVVSPRGKHWRVVFCDSTRSVPRSGGLISLFA